MELVVLWFLILSGCTVKVIHPVEIDIENDHDTQVYDCNYPMDCRRV